MFGFVLFYTEDESPYMVFEYMEYGDLAGLLRGCDSGIGACAGRSTIELKQVNSKVTY